MIGQISRATRLDIRFAVIAVLIQNVGITAAAVVCVVRGHPWFALFFILCGDSFKSVLYPPEKE